MVRKITWHYWAVIIAGLVAYGLLGWWWSSNGTAEEWIYRIGLTAAPILAALFVTVYTVRAKWWKNEIGTALVLSALAIIPVTAPLAYVFWFNHGILTSSWLAWLEVSGPCLSALAMAWMSRIWLKIRKDQS